MTQEQRDIKRKLAALRYAEECGNVAITLHTYLLAIPAVQEEAPALITGRVFAQS